MNVTQKLEELMLSIEGLCAIFVTDYDGGIVLQVGDIPRFKPILISGHLNVVGQIPKLLMGEHESSYFQFEYFQLVVHSINKYFFFTIAGNNTPAGALLDFRHQLATYSTQLLKVCPPIENEDDEIALM